MTKTGDRAYGKYQVMGANIPEWTRVVLGKSMTPEQFLSDPDAQDAVFNTKFGGYVGKYGPEGAAKAWFAGEKGMNNPNARDQLGTTVQGYADRFMSNLGGRAGPQAVDTAAQGRPPQAIPQQDAQVADRVSKLMAVIDSPYSTDAQKSLAATAVKELIPTPDQWSSAGDGYLFNSRNGQIKRGYVPDDKTPNSVREYNFYRENVPAGEKPMDYATWSSTKARAGATTVNNNVDLGATQSYDKQLAEGLGKSHASLANGVEDAQSRARDIAAMQGAVDAIQRNGGTTGRHGPTADPGLEEVHQLRCRGAWDRSRLQ